MVYKILIAEDEKPIANVLKLKLNKSGFEAKAVYDGIQAIVAMNDQKFDLVLLDLVMPNLDGFGVLEKMKQKGITTPVIVSTNLSQKSDIEKAKSLGAVDYFVKSDTSINGVVEHIKKILHI